MIDLVGPVTVSGRRFRGDIPVTWQPVEHRSLERLGTPLHWKRMGGKRLVLFKLCTNQAIETMAFHPTHRNFSGGIVTLYPTHYEGGRTFSLQLALFKAIMELGDYQLIITPE